MHPFGIEGGKGMDRPLREHISLLEQRIRDLNQEIMENRLSAAERNHIEAEIRAAQHALEYYHRALEIEQQLV